MKLVPLKDVKKIQIIRDPGTSEILNGRLRIENETRSRKGKRQKISYWVQFINGKWLFGKNPNAIDIPYQLHLVDKNQFIYLIEGEKSTDRLNGILPEDHLAIGLAGSQARLNFENIKYLKGKTVYLLPDIDHHGQGQSCMAENFLVLKENGIDCHIIDIAQGLREFSGFDVEDWINRKSGQSLEEIYQDFDKIIKRASQEFDYEFIEKYLIKENNGVKEFRSRYVSNILPPKLNKKLTIIQSTQDTGKTTYAKGIIEQYKKQGKKIVYLVHRSALAKQIAEQMGLMFYEDNLIEKYQYISSESMAICLNSVHKLKLKQYGNCLVVIDEVDQFLDQIFGSTVKENRQKIFRTLETLFENSSNVLVMSTDITQGAKEYLLNICKLNNYEYYRNSYSQEKKGKFHNSQLTIINEIENDLQNGKRISLAHGSRTQLSYIKTKLKNKFPDKKIICIDSHNSKSKKVQDLICNTEKSLEYDAILYSPSLFSGVDFNHPFAKKHYVIADNKELCARDYWQGANRFRQAKEIHFYIPPTIRESLITNEQDLLMQYTSKHNRFKELKVWKAGLVFEIISDFNDYIQLAAINEADRNEQSKDLRKSFLGLLKDKNIKYEIFQDTDTEKNKQIGEELKEIRKTVKEETKEKILSADIITKTEYKEIKQNGARCERDSIQKTKFEYYLSNGESTEDLETIVNIFEPGEFRSITDSWKRFNKPIEESLEDDRKNERDYWLDNSHHALKAQCRLEIESVIQAVQQLKKIN